MDRHTGRSRGDGSNNSRSPKRLRSLSIEAVEEATWSLEEEDGRNTQNRGTKVENGDRGFPRDNIDRGKSISITLLDTDLLDCPICCEPLSSPIFQCCNGHIACSACVPKLMWRCPVCEVPVGSFRCRGLEKVMEAAISACPYAKFGCKELNVPYAELGSHEKSCVFVPCSCPIPGCIYTGYYKDLRYHIRARHEHSLLPFTWNAKTDHHALLVTEDARFVLVEENDGDVFVLQISKDYGGAYVRVNCISPLVPSAGLFSCTVKNFSCNGSLLQEFIVKNIQKLQGIEPLPEDDFMFIPSHMLLSAETGSEKVCLQMWIGRGRSFHYGC